MRINVNLASLNIYRNQVNNQKVQSKASNNISSGSRINNSADDPNGLAKSEKMRVQIRALDMSARNAQDGASMLQAVDGTLSNVNNVLLRIKELTIQAGSASTDDDKQVMQNEIEQLTEGIDSMVKYNDFNGVNIIYDSTSDNSNPNVIKMQAGIEVGEQVDIPLYNLSKNSLGKEVSTNGLKDINVVASGGVDSALNIVNSAIGTVLSARSKYGAIENRFEDVGDRLSRMSITVQKAESQIRDADIADEMMEYARAGILIEAGTALMAQTNRFPQDVLRVLENVKSR